jgi:hypothetical protein
MSSTPASAAGSGLLSSLAAGSPPRSGSGCLPSPVDQLFAAARLLGQPGFCEAPVMADTNGCCPSVLAGPGLSAPVAGASGPLAGGEEAPRKLAILGLPWETRCGAQRSVASRRSGPGAGKAAAGLLL